MPSQQEVRVVAAKGRGDRAGLAALLTTLLFLMTSASGMGLFSKKLIVMTYFENSAGLKKGGEVQLQGVTIGEVKDVTCRRAGPEIDAGGSDDEARSRSFRPV